MSHRVLSYHLIEAAKQMFALSPTRLSPEQKAQALARAERAFLLESRVLSCPEAVGVDVAEDSLANAVKLIETRYPSHQEFLADLAINGLSLEILREALYRELRTEAVLDKIADSAPPVTDVQIDQAYLVHRAQFDRPETRQVRHILITLNPDYADNTREAAHARLTALAGELGPTPTTEDFAAAALRCSECPTALQGGVLGRVPRGQLYPQLDEALFHLAAGEMSGVVESEIGFHLVYCERVWTAGVMTREEAAPILRTALEKNHREAARKAWLAGLLRRTK